MKPWPNADDYAQGISEECRFQRDTAEAAIERLRVAVGALQYTREHIGVQDDAPFIHSRCFNALAEIGDIP